MAVLDPGELPPEGRSVAAHLGVRAGPYIWEVLTGLPADSAGLRSGDRIVSVNAVPTPTGDTLRRVLERARALGFARIQVQRLNNITLDRELRAVSACHYPAGLLQEDVPNAFADGSRIFVTTGMMRLVNSDDELALVLAHELAHNLLGHVQQDQLTMLAATTIGLFLDVAASTSGVDTQGQGTRLGAQVATALNRSFSITHEADADYLGIYIVARAGYDMGAATDFWRRMGAEYPTTVQRGLGATHPSTPERASSLAAARAEIAFKQGAGLPLVPEVRSGALAESPSASRDARFLRSDSVPPPPSNPDLSTRGSPPSVGGAQVEPPSQASEAQSQLACPRRSKRKLWKEFVHGYEMWLIGCKHIDGTIDGPVYGYHRGGGIGLEAEFRGGQRIGRWRTLDPNGQLVHETDFSGR